MIIMQVVVVKQIITCGSNLTKPNIHSTINPQTEEGMTRQQVHSF